MSRQATHGLGDAIQSSLAPLYDLEAFSDDERSEVIRQVSQATRRTLDVIARDTGSPSNLIDMGGSMLRKAKALLVMTVALWGFVGAFQNVSDWSGTLTAVGAATSMATFDGGAASWHATSNPAVVWIGALFILLSKVATGVMCTIGALGMWRARATDLATFAAAREIALTGCAVAVIMLFGGFIVIAESWFELWRSAAMRGPVLESAFRYGGMITLIAIFVAMQDE